jgi:polysaccharide pyruvyl transferase WcaK-like protein
LRVVVSNVYADDNRGGAALTATAIEAARLVGATTVTLLTLSTNDDLGRAFRHTRRDYPDVVILPAVITKRRGALGTAAAILTSLVYLAAPRSAAARLSPGLRAILDADVVMGKGGQLFRRFPIRGGTGFWLSAFPLVFASRHGIRSAAYGISIGPYDGARFAEWLAGVVLRRLDVVFPRDEPSRQLAVSLGVRPDAIVPMPDSAMLLTPPTEREIDEARQRHGLSGQRFAVVTINESMTREAVRQGVFTSLRTCVRVLLEQSAIDRVLVVIQTGGLTTDLDASRDFESFVGDPRVTVFDADLGYRELLALYGGAEFVTGGRVHSTIFAVIAGRPGFPIDYVTPKAQAIFAGLGLDDLPIALPCSGEDMASKIAGWLNDPDRIARVVDTREQLSRAVAAAASSLKP